MLDTHLPTPLAARAEVCASALPPRATRPEALPWELATLNPRAGDSVISVQTVSDLSSPAWFWTVALLCFLLPLLDLASVGLAMIHELPTLLPKRLFA